ncbi:cytochrome b/b6 domain-containing protein [Rhodoferax ferrireducens]|uniref:cytochrome b/b6 domain-containing protein n=1 Tax=Rhodoferax ferrireducens TaxID=192843 RepID=UPI00298E34B5|nr:cytochrome b/b6 domain-containing protein [Rhodoferax ferrireducens]WPC67467.1 cytochrome b/b6 domain-containing protein [Rhodoferax ferrireducens]
MSHKVRVWDLPTRCFHWGLVVCFMGLITSAQIGGDAMAWHFRSGYAVLSLLLFRIIWGLVGGRWSRFTSFIYAPAAILAYVKGRGLPEHTVGHNPLGSGSVFAMLGFLLLQVMTGLVSDDEIANAGPLSQFVSNAAVSFATFYHAAIGRWVLIGLVVLHLSAIFFYHLKKRQNLVLPMLLGDKETDSIVMSSRDDLGSRTWALALFLGCAALVAGMVKLAG